MNAEDFYVTGADLVGGPMDETPYVTEDFANQRIRAAFAAGEESRERRLFDELDQSLHGVVANLNDTLGYATADAETLWEDDLPDDWTIWDLYQRFGWHGLVAVAAEKRGVEPIAPIRENEKYQAPLEALRAAASKGQSR